MADGTKKPISEVEVGDEVLATDPETGDLGPANHLEEILTLARTRGLVGYSGVAGETLRSPGTGRGLVGVAAL